MCTDLYHDWSEEDIVNRLPDVGEHREIPAEYASFVESRNHGIKAAKEALEKRKVEEAKLG